MFEHRAVLVAETGKRMREFMTPEDFEDVETFRLGHSNRPVVRRAAFGCVLSIADRNPGLSSDDILEELEALDAKSKVLARAG